MQVTQQLKKVLPVYFWTSSFLFGGNEFIHSFHSCKKMELQRYIIDNVSIDTNKMRDITFDSYKKATPAFLSGVVLGPILPVLYMAGFRPLDWTRCPYMK